MNTVYARLHIGLNLFVLSGQVFFITIMTLRVIRTISESQLFKEPSETVPGTVAAVSSSQAIVRPIS